MCVGARASVGASVELALLFTGGGRPPGVLGARLIRAFLANRLGGPEEVWTVGHDAAGAPFALREGRSRPVHVSLSYAEGLVAAALSTASPLGIDVERLSPHGADGALADSFFSEPERAFLASLAQEERKAAFFRIWTLKEAYIKARRMGFALPLDGFSVVDAEGRPALLLPEGQAEGWTLGELGLPSGHRLGLAIAAPAARLCLFRATASGPSFAFAAQGRLRFPAA